MPISSSSAAPEIAVPRDALRFILLQRTDYLALPQRRLLFRCLKRLSPWPPIETAVRLEAAWRGRTVRRAFNEDMEREYAEIRPWLPPGARAVLDIGCGVGGIDVLLHRHYGRPADLHFYLLDRSHTSSGLWYGFEREAAFYNSLALTGRMLAENGVPEECIHLREVREDRRIDAPPVDLVLSLISWGFHYPLSTYLDQVVALLRPGGTLILDVRRATGGEEELRARFREVHTVSEASKKVRVAAVKG